MFDRILIFSTDTANAIVSAPDLEDLKGKGALVTTTLQEAMTAMETTKYYFPVLVADQYSEAAQKFLQGCTQHLPTLCEYFTLVSNDPDPKLQGAAYEIGLKNLWGGENFASKLTGWIQSVDSKVKADESQDQAMLKLAVLVARARKGNKSKDIEPSIEKLSEDATHDYRIAFLLGHACMAVQQFDQAEKYFTSCTTLNPKFIPATVSLAQLRLQNASPKEAFAMLEKLEKLNSSNSERKALLAAACADAGNWEVAKKYMAEAEKLEPENSRVKEMRVRAAFETGNVQEALALLDKCDVIDEYFITKLNDQAIGLSKNNKTQEALTLYHKAHDLASPHIKFKISFNIALAYKRQNDFPKALQMLDVVDQEVGDKSFEKSAKLRQQIKEEMTKK